MVHANSIMQSIKQFNMTNEEAAKMLFAVVGILRGYEMTMGIRLEDMETTEEEPNA